MVRYLNWVSLKGWVVRLNAAFRCLRRKHFVLVCWVREKDGDLTFYISHKGVEIPEAIHRLQVDAAEILQDVDDQNSALDMTNKIIDSASG